MTKNRSATKSGPGRLHKQGHGKAVPPKYKGAGPDFVQRRNPRRNAERHAARARNLQKGGGQ